MGVCCSPPGCLPACSAEMLLGVQLTQLLSMDLDKAPQDAHEDQIMQSAELPLWLQLTQMLSMDLDKAPQDALEDHIMQSADIIRRELGLFAKVEMGNYAG